MNDPLIKSHTAPKFAAQNPGIIAEWYSSQLGFPNKAVFDNGAYAIVNRGKLTLHLWRCDDRTIAENTACYTELESVELLNQLHAEFLTRSQSSEFAPGRLQAQPKDACGHAMREFHVWDPAGNLIGFGAQI